MPDWGLGMRPGQICCRLGSAGNALERNIKYHALVSSVRKLLLCQLPIYLQVILLYHACNHMTLRPSTCLLAERASCCSHLLVSATRKISLINPCLPYSAHLPVRSSAITTTTTISSSRIPASRVFSDHSTRVLLRSRSKEEDCLALP